MMMKNLLTIGAILFGICTVWGQLPPNTVSRQVIEISVKEVAGKHATVQWESLPLPASFPPKWRKLLPDDSEHIYIGKVKGERSLEVVISRSKGKVEYFIFAVYFNPQSMEIWDVDVLDYREAYGGEIDYKAFRRQFKGKQFPEDIVFRRTIRNISGATISARSITRRVKEVLAMYRYLKENRGEASEE